MYKFTYIKDDEINLHIKSRKNLLYLHTKNNLHIYEYTINTYILMQMDTKESKL